MLGDISETVRDRTGSRIQTFNWYRAVTLNDLERRNGRYFASF